MLQRIRSIRGALIALFAATMLLLVVPVSGIASAHDQLIDSSPSEGEDFAEAPPAATLRFSAEMITIGAEIALLDGATSEVIPLPEALEIDYDTVTQPLPELGAGTYSLNWRVVSQDGHPIAGTISFTVAGGTGEPSGPAQTDDVDADPASALLTEPWKTVVFGVVAVLVLAGAGIAFVVRMRRGNQPGN